MCSQRNLIRSSLGRSPLALICGGGGLYGSFIAGVVTELFERVCEVDRFKAIAATSASVGTVLHYLSYRKAHRGESIWTQALVEGGVLAAWPLWRILAGKPLLNLDALVETFKKTRLCVPEKIAKVRQRLIVPLMSMDDGKIEYWENERLAGQDLYKIMEAAKSAPVLAERLVEIGGRTYTDPGFRESFVWDHPVLNPVKKLVVVSQGTYTAGQRRFYARMGECCRWQRWGGIGRLLPDWMYQEVGRAPETYDALFGKALAAEERGEALVIAPTEPLTFNYLRPVDSLKHNFVLGQEYVRQHEARLVAFVRG